jgi:hypothetical protein
MTFCVDRTFTENHEQLKFPQRTFNDMLYYMSKGVSHTIGVYDNSIRIFKDHTTNVRNLSAKRSIGGKLLHPYPL